MSQEGIRTKNSSNSFIHNDALDLTGMEELLTSLIKEEEKYKRENDAKFRAIAQNVPTYEHFRDIVKASHLKPLETKDKTHLRPNKIWNTFKADDNSEKPEYKTSQNRCFVGSHILDSKLANLEKEIWNINDAKERYAYLQTLAKEKLQVFLSSDLCASCLGLILRTLSEMEENMNSYDFVLDTLEQLTKPVHFNAALSLLNEDDREVCRNVFHKLRSIKVIQATTENTTDDQKFTSVMQVFGM